MSDFHIGGPVPVNAEAYHVRPFEASVREELASGRWVLLLGPRQHGKTSALLRLRADLTDQGYRIGIVSLQAAPPTDGYKDLLAWFFTRLARELKVDPPAPNKELQMDFGEWMRTLLNTVAEPVVVVIDEASGIPDAVWRNAFYGQLRSLSQEVDPLPTPLLFVFAGTFRPESLVDDRNSPFNVCQKIYTDDLTLADAHELWRAVVDSEASNALVDEAYALAGGQPYLLQVLFSAIAISDDEETQRDGFQAAMARLRAGADDHFEGVFSKVFAEGGLTNIAAEIVRNGRVPNEPANGDFLFLQTLGFAKRDGANLVVRNEIYREFAAASPQLSEELAAGATGHVGNLISPPDDAYDFVADERYREFGLTAHVGAVRAYNAGSYRLALVGFGSALECLLISALVGLEPADLAKAIRSARARFNDYEEASDPGTWKLHNLIRIARAANIGTYPIDPPDALRQWRNQIHPAVAVQFHRPSAELEPEARIASGLMSAVLRDLTPGT
jgi:hypothetical protein